MQNKSNTFTSRFGMIAATIGSAIGLGNVWRFPAETQANGGAAFLIIYILCVLLLGIPVMIGEFSLGKGGGSDSIGIYKNLSPKTKWWITGSIGLLASYIILAFYIVVAGWTLEYLFYSLTGDLYSATDSLTGEALFKEKMGEYIGTPVRPLVFTYIIIFANLAILVMGVQKGIEKVSSILMPVLFLVLIAFIIYTLRLPKASEGLKFFLSPDFSKIDLSVIINAMGQAFFSLSLGMGVLTTYASYFPKNTNLTKTAITVSMLDLLVAFMMGLIIFPAVASFGLENQTFEGATLVFVTLPEVFENMDGGQIWSCLFFILLLVAAITSTISIAEVAIAFFRDRFRMSRTKACLLVIVPLLFFSALCSLSLTPGSPLTLFEKTLFDNADNLATNILLPTGAFFMCIYLGWFSPKGFLKNQVESNSRIGTVIFPLLMFIIKFVAPPIIFVILISGLF